MLIVVRMTVTNVVELRSTVLVNVVVISDPAVTFDGMVVESEAKLVEFPCTVGPCADSVPDALLFTENGGTTLDVPLAGKGGIMLDVLFARNGGTMLSVLVPVNGGITLAVLFSGMGGVKLDCVTGWEEFDTLTKVIVA